MDDTRRFRGMFGMALTWGIGLATLAVGALALGLATDVVPSAIFGVRAIVAVAERGLLVGGVAGGLFGWILSRRERGHSVATLSTRRVALWGFAAAASVPAMIAVATAGPSLPLGVLVAGTLGFGGIGSLLGTSTLGIARRAEARLEADEDPKRLPL